MKELSCATFFVNLTAKDAVFHTDSNDVQAVLHHLQRHYYHVLGVAKLLPNHE